MTSIHSFSHKESDELYLIAVVGENSVVKDPYVCFLGYHKVQLYSPKSNQVL